MDKDDKIPPYEAWLHWDIIKRCNLDCTYCFVNPVKRSSEAPTIDIPAVIKALDDTPFTYKITLTGGGEPFLVRNIIELCKELSKKHYLSFNTNLTSGKVKEFAEVIDPSRVYEIHASLHIEELERLNLLERYVEHFHLLRDKGISIYAQVVAYPTLVPKLDRYRQYFKEKDIEIHFSPFVGVYQGTSYPKGYTDQELGAFGFKRKEVEASFRYKNKPCNAGHNLLFVTPSGKVQSCTQIFDNRGQIDKKIDFKSHLTLCPFEFCHCPLNYYDQYLWKKALKENSEKPKKPSLLATGPYLIKDVIRDIVFKFRKRD